METKKMRARAFEVEAFQWDPENPPKLSRAFRKFIQTFPNPRCLGAEIAPGVFTSVNIGNYVVMDKNGKVEVLSSSEFGEKYEELVTPELEMKTYRAILSSLCDENPDERLTAVPPRELDDKSYLYLQEWCANHAMCEGFTGQGMIETAWESRRRMEL